jgi:hypothetical protein
VRLNFALDEAQMAGIHALKKLFGQDDTQADR